MFNTYPRPIPTPVHDLRPARETCETCHWPQKFGGYRLRIIPKFAEDEANTATKTVLLMRIGGGTGAAGIHGTHLGPGVVIEYASDRSRQNIPWVRYGDSDGRSTEFAIKEWQPEQLGKLERRVMDCVDCHNRPTHTFDLPEPALDKALAAGRISPSLPMIRKEGARILKGVEVAAGIPAAVERVYREQYPAVYQEREKEIKQAAQALVDIFNRNVFPEMKVTWGSYPNNIGHTYFPGCFRCHDGSHASASGKTISQDCNSCHQLLAMEEAAPKIITELGIAPPATQ